MAPKKTSQSIIHLKKMMEEQKKREEELKKQEEEEEKRLREEEKLAEEQRIYEEEQRKQQNELDKQKIKDNKEIDKKKHNEEILKRMHQAGMIIAGYEDQPLSKPPPIEILKSSSDLKQNEYIAQNTNNINTTIRSPICCVLGHVDAGKTSLLDKIRESNVQKKETRGITQQIGASFLPHDMLSTKCNNKNNITVPGLLMLDTPGHEQFVNLRNRGSSICDIAVLVIDFFNGLEKQTIESLNLLKQKKCPFIVAINKVDKIYGWKKNNDLSIIESLKLQNEFTISEYNKLCNQIILQLAEQGINSQLFYKNDQKNKYVSIVPISAINGEGICDLIDSMIDLVQKYLTSNILIKNTIECTIMDIKPVVGLGMTMDVILANGTLNVHDEIMICGINAPITTKITKLLTPKVGMETKSDNTDYCSHKSVSGAMCVKICANMLEEAISGSDLYVCKNHTDKIKYHDILVNSVESILSTIQKNPDGLIVQTSTLGSLEAIVMQLNNMKIPIYSAGLGAVQKKNIYDLNNIKNKKYALLLAFDVGISEQAQEMINDNIKTQIIKSNIIYEMFDSLKKYIDKYDADIKEKNKSIAIFPVKMKIIEVFARHNPLIVGCRILDGQLKIGTPLCILNDNNERFILGKVIGLQINKKDITTGKIGDEVGIKIQCIANNISYGRTIEKESILYSAITRESIDALKESFKNDMTINDWKLIVALKKEQNIV
jgi:translation initiation factor 5B